MYMYLQVQASSQTITVTISVLEVKTDAKCTIKENRSYMISSTTCFAYATGWVHANAVIQVETNFLFCFPCPIHSCVSDASVPKPNNRGTISYDHKALSVFESWWQTSLC